MRAYTRDELRRMFSKPVVLDGGFATQAEKLGYNIEEETDPKCRLWSGRMVLTDPNGCEQVHLSFLRAGAQLIMTNTFRFPVTLLPEYANTDGKPLGESGAKELVQTSVDVVRRAIETYRKESGDSTPKLVVGAVGPFHAMVVQKAGEPSHCYDGAHVDWATTDAMTAYFVEQATALTNAGVDVIFFETIPAFKEAECVVAALDGVPDRCACVVAFACKDQAKLGHGESFADAVDLVTGHDKVLAAGVNCTDPLYVTALLRSAAGRTHGKPFVVYPNTGEAYRIKLGWHGDKRDMGELPKLVDEWVNLGATIIGGCCRVYDGEIKLIAQCLKQKQ